MIRFSKSFIACARRRAPRRTRFRNPRGRSSFRPPTRHVRVVHPRAGRRLHQVLDHLALAERVEDRRHRAELERVRALNIRWFRMRFHSANIVRIHCARSGTSIPASRSTAIDPAELVVERARASRGGSSARAPAGCRGTRRASRRPRCMYPITGSARVMTSPSSSSTIAEHAVRRRVLRPDVEDHLLGRRAFPAGTTSTSSPPPRTIEVPRCRGTRGARSVSTMAPHPTERRGATAVSRRSAARHVGSGHAVDARRSSSPSVDALLRSRTRQACGRILRPAAPEALPRRDPRRGARGRGGRRRGPRRDDDILARARQRASRIASGLTPVINATGVVLHTNLGRAPLPGTAAARRGPRGRARYADLEVDRATGKRGRRGGRAERAADRAHRRRGRARREQLRGRAPAARPRGAREAARRSWSRAAS